MLSLSARVSKVVRNIWYIGDPDTGVVHVSNGSCVIESGQVFLDLRTALVRGYRVCTCCRS